MSQLLVAIAGKQGAPIPLLPMPVGTYDVLNYDSNTPSNLPDSSFGGFGDATLNLGNTNGYDDSDPTNPYISIYAPNNFPSQTGGVLAPSIPDIQSVEMWCRLPTAFTGYGQVFLDFRTGGGYIITGASGNNDGNVVGATMYVSTIPQTITASTWMNPILEGATWRHIVIVFTAPFTDDCAFFMRYNSGDQFEFVQGCPVDFGEISIYQAELTAGNVVSIFNQKCGRYGLSPV